MVEQLQTMLGSMAPGFMKAYGVQALLAELMEGVHKDLEAKTS
ncbi:hypothetical protein HaLaN_24652, partial [Haematococcus lacustris]